MKIALVTTPIRPNPTSFPPLGSLAIIQSLDEVGYTVEFLNIDYHRCDEKQIFDWLTAGRYDVIVISAVVSTAYAYTKWLTEKIQVHSPRSIVLLGGNLAASAEILLRKCNIQFCVIGDGEIPIKHLIKALEGKQKPELKKSNFDHIEGVAFINDNDVFQFNGFGAKYDPEELKFPNLKILENDGSLQHYIQEEPLSDETSRNVDAFLAKAKRKTMTVISSKGCVARCTFCHRFERGYRPKPVNQIMEYLNHIRKEYGITHIDFGDENFGANKPLTRELAVALGVNGFTWQVAGVRVRTVNRDDLQLWRDNGCERAYFGIESGSPKMLKIMEKGASLEQNIEALRSVSEVGISTVIQLIVGMPGENDQTISETIEFLKKVSDFSRDWDGEVPSQFMSINYAQALPDTPLYEWAREHGFIGLDLDSEEEYLIAISDTDAYAEDHFINYTGFPLLKVLTWRPTILAQVDAYHLGKTLGGEMSLFRVMLFYWNIIFKKTVLARSTQRSNGNGHAFKDGYFNIHRSFPIAPFYMNKFLRPFAYPITALIVAFWRGGSLQNALKLMSEHIFWSLSSPTKAINVDEL